MKITLLGTGTSTGIPQIGCTCATCTSTDIRDKRLRASALIETGGRRLLIDCGPDFRQQILSRNSPELDALLVTHSHYDHVGGLDDLRPYCYRHNGFPVYCTVDVALDLRNRLPYCFTPKPIPGTPRFDIHTITPGQTFSIDGIDIIPLPVMHGKLPIVGFRIGSFAYITDCRTMPEPTLSLLHGIDSLIINALRHEEHMSHMNLRQALEIINKIAPRRAVLTHLSHDMGTHAETARTLPDGVEIATDGMVIEVSGRI